MRMSDTIYFDKLTDTHKMPEWIRAERYEYCEDFYGSMTEDKSKSFFARLLQEQELLRKTAHHHDKHLCIIDLQLTKA